MTPPCLPTLTSPAEALRWICNSVVRTGQRCRADLTRTLLITYRRTYASGEKCAQVSPPTEGQQAFSCIGCAPDSSLCRISGRQTTAERHAAPYGLPQLFVAGRSTLLPQHQGSTLLASSARFTPAQPTSPKVHQNPNNSQSYTPLALRISDNRRESPAFR